MAFALVEGSQKPDPAWTATHAVLDEIHTTIAPAMDACGAAEIDGLLRGLDGRFVPPGPSGAPTRGRPDVLPTGRNFYSIDTRTAPSPAASSASSASNNDRIHAMLIELAEVEKVKGDSMRMNAYYKAARAVKER